MIYVSIDLETTGLNPEKHQILEVGAVAVDLETGTILGVFESMVWWPEVTGSPFALDMNSRILKETCTWKGRQIGDGVWNSVGKEFRYWLSQYLEDGKINAAGRQFEAFDKAFLKSHGFDTSIFRRRVLDPSPLFIRHEDDQLPSLDKIVERAGVDDSDWNRHGALSDAIMVSKCIQAWYAKHKDVS